MNLLRGAVTSIIAFVLIMFLLFAAEVGSNVKYTDNIALPIAISLVIGLGGAIDSNKKDK